MPETRVALYSRRSPIERGCGDALVDLLDADPILRRYAVDGVELDRVGLYALRERLLEDSHAPVRLAAGERLARAGASLLDEGVPTRAEVVGWLVEALADAMPSVREVACRALARHASLEHGCAEQLARRVLEDPVWWVRRAAARALAAVAGEAAIPGLIAGLEDPFWRVRHGIVQALELIVTRSSSDESERERLRVRTLEAGAGLEEAARAALAYLASGWPEGEDEVPEVLGIIRDPGAGLELSDADPAVVTARLHAAGHVDPASLIPLLAESHEALREEASRRLAALDDPSCLEPALAWLEDPRIPNAPAAVRALLRKLGGRARGLAEQALKFGRPGGLVWAAEWIADHSAEALHGRLFKQLGHPRASVRAAIVGAVGRLLVRERGRDQALRGYLFAALRDDAREVRDAAVLGLLEARVIEPSLSDVDVSDAVRARVLLACGSAEACTDALGDRSAVVRAATVVRLRSLECLGVDARARALSDGDPWVRAAAIDLDAAIAVFTAADERDASVRRASARTLVSARASLPAELTEVLLEQLRQADDPWLRARAADLVDAEDPSDEEVAGLLLATRDKAAMVRLAAAARLDVVPSLADRIERALAERGDPELAIAAWSRLVVALDPEQARARLERALASELDEQVRAHMGELAVLFGAEPPAAMLASIEIVERAPTRPVANVARRALGRSGLELAPLIVSGAFSLTPSSLALAAERGVDTYFWEPRGRADPEQQEQIDAVTPQPSTRGL
ncbi:MAG TPA: HEAT repeat domain-containing protein, partial [Enhygromyxa sp.]|nr:HEAT repeat domain-containing protein [Enhygromyxa sp.]